MNSWMCIWQSSFAQTNGVYSIELTETLLIRTYEGIICYKMLQMLNIFSSGLPDLFNKIVDYLPQY